MTAPLPVVPLKTVDATVNRLLKKWGYAESAVERLREGGKDREREKALSWVNGLVSKRGRDRGKSIFFCGVLFPALLPDGRVVVMPRSCRDRGCPRCMASRAVSLGNAIAAAAAHREGAGAKLLFVTLTQPKAHAADEDASGALDRMLAAWGRLTRTSSGRKNYVLRDMMRGGLRSIECVWSGRGRQTVWEGRVTHTVKYSGWHAHLHCIFELEEGVTVEDFSDELRGTWEDVCPGANASLCVNIQPLAGDAVRQCAKYCTKPFELPGTRARELFRAVESRHMVYGWGEWLGWSSWVEPEPNPLAGAVLCVEPLHALLKRFAEYDEQGRGALVPEPASFAEWHTCPDRGERTHRLVTAMPIRELHSALAASAMSANESAQKARELSRERAAEREANKKPSPPKWRGGYAPPEL